MSNIEEPEDKKEKISPTGLTLQYMNVLSKFAYYDDINYKLADNSKLLLHDEIEKATLLGSIVPSDYFVLLSVASFSWANCEMVTRDISRRKQREPEKAYPVAKMETIKSSLSRLSRNSLIRGFEYKSESGTPIKVYCSTESGIYFLKKKLYYDGNIETFNSLNPPEETFRRLASNYVAQRLSFCGNNSKFIPGTWVYLNNVGKVFIYSQLKYTADSDEHFVMVEPFYLRCNTAITSKNEMITYSINRFSIIKAMKEKQEEKRKFSLVVVVEDTVGLKEALKYYTSEFSEYISNIYFTTENAVFMSNKSFARGFLKIEKIEEGTPSVKACSNLDFIKSL